MSHPAKVIDLYDSLLDAKDDRTRARIIASAFESLEDRYPELKDMVTASGMRQTELRLQKEIEQVRLRIEEVRNELGKDIEQVRLRIEEVRNELGKDIEQVRLRIEEVRNELTVEIHKVRADLSKQIEQVRLRIEEVRNELGKDIEQMRLDLTQKIASGNVKMLFWTAGLLFAQLLTVVAVILGTR